MGRWFSKNAKKFDDVLALSKKVILNKKASIVLVGEFPTYPNNEIGWITVGDKIKSKDSENSTNIASFPFVEFVYRPDVHACGRLFEGGTGLWNTGYFISTIVYILSLYKKYKPQMYQQLVEMEKVFDTEKEGEVVSKIYPEIEKVHFDHVVPYNIKPKDAIVVGAKMGWFDPGTLYALKKFFAPNEENYTSGNAIAHNCRDCMILNKEGGKIVAIVGLEGKIVVNTKDALLVIDKDQVGEIKEVLEFM